MINKNEFEDYICKRNDEIESIVYDLACVLSALPNGNKPEWDISYIAEITSAAERILQKHNIPTCYPYYESNDIDNEETPCPESDTCHTLNCMFANK